MSFNLPPKILRSEIAASFRNDMQKVVDKKGTIERADVSALFAKVYDQKTDSVSSEAAEALAYVSEEFRDKMDVGAKSLAADFTQAYHSDSMGGLTDEYRRQAQTQLAQSKTNFKDFMREDYADHKEQTIDEFREELQDNRIETSDWQTLTLWLQTGVKRNPFTS